MNSLFGKLGTWLLLGVAFLSLLGCASQSELRYHLQGIKSTSINSNIDLAGNEATDSRQLQPLYEWLARDFARKVTQAGVFPQPVAVVKTPLRNWGDEISEMRYDGQFKLKLHPGTREGQWHLEALLQSRYGVIVWRNERVLNTLSQGEMEASLEGLVKNLARAHR